MRKLWDIPGGVHPPANKTQSTTQSVASLPLPPRLTLPVSQHLGEPAEPMVEVGQTVLRGELIARGRERISANVHASTSGRISALEEHPLPHPSGLAGLCIEIEADGEDRWCPLTPCEDFRAQSPQALLEKIQGAGIAGMGGAGFPAAPKLASDRPIQTLIINGAECEPYITADDLLMREHAADIAAGMALLAYILGNPGEVLLAIEDNKPEAIEMTAKAVAELDDPRLEVVAVPTKYPSGGEKQLIQILTGREVPSGELPANLGIVCQNVGTVQAAWRAVRHGEPLTERITTVTGETLDKPGNRRVRLGTPVDFVLEQAGYRGDASRLVIGGSMMGFTLADPRAPIVKTSNCLLAPSTAEAPPPAPPQPCIRCGHCAEVCPAGLLPQQLYWYARAEDEEKLNAHNLFDCIECGACSYVCPSQLPLVQYYRAAKGEIRRREAQQAHAERARRRYEFQKERLEQERAARARAREAAQAKARNRQQQSEQGPDKRAKLLGAATAKKQSKADSPERLRRRLLSAEDRVGKLQEKLTTAEDKDRGALEARLREAEIERDKLARQLEHAQADAGPAERSEG